MTTMNISLPDEVKAFVESQMILNGHASVSELLRALILDEQKRRAKHQLDLKLMEGLEGPAVTMSDEDWDAIERDAQLRLDGEKVRS